MSSKLISVIVPVYNAEKYLDALIESIINQTKKELEIILINDGSSDNSADICERFSKTDKRIKVFYQKNSGQSAARNTGLKHASGDYIAFVDNDDYLCPYMYEALENLIEKHNADYSACNFQHASDEEIKHITFPDIDYSKIKFLTPEEYIQNYFSPTWKIPIWNKLYKKELIENLYFSDYHLGEDNLFSYRVCIRSTKLVFLDYPMYVQRIHGNNFEFTGSRYMNELNLAKEKILNDVKSRFPQKYFNLKKQFIYECIRIYNNYIDRDDFNNTETAYRILKRQCSEFSKTDIPIRHKLLLFKIKFGIIKPGSVIKI